jgi:catalase (peroxidase I)
MKTAFVALGVTVTQAGKCPFGFTADNALAQTHKPSDITYPNEYFKCRGKAMKKTTNFTFADYRLVANDIIRQYEQHPDTHGDNKNPRGKYAACLVRLVGHDFMDFRKDNHNKGGADGCLDFSDPDNLGLEQCIQNFKIQDVYAKHCTKVSLADFFVIAAEAAMGRSATGYKTATRWDRHTLLG